MFTLGSQLVYHLYNQSCDMRKSFNGLSGLIKDTLKGDPVSGEVFIFINRTKNRIKILHWEHDGFMLYYKRLEKGTFSPPILDPEKHIITWPELVLLMAGIRVEKSIQKPRFKLKQ